jgi:hypothetical protein
MPFEVECISDAGPAGLPFLLRFTITEWRKATAENPGIDAAKVSRKMLMRQS